MVRPFFAKELNIPKCAHKLKLKLPPVLNYTNVYIRYIPVTVQRH